MSAHRHLNVIEIEEPCTEDWDLMSGDGDVRFCGLCRQNVFDLTALSDDEVLAFLRDSGQDTPCIRFVRRVDGTASLEDCTPSRMAVLRARTRKRLLAAGVMIAGLFSTVTLGLLSVIVTTDTPCESPAVELEPRTPYPLPPKPVVPAVEPTPVFEAPPADHPPRHIIMGRPARR